MLRRHRRVRVRRCARVDKLVLHAAAAVSSAAVATAFSAAAGAASVAAASVAASAVATAAHAATATATAAVASATTAARAVASATDAATAVAAAAAAPAVSAAVAAASAAPSSRVCRDGRRVQRHAASGVHGRGGRYGCGAVLRVGRRLRRVDLRRWHSSADGARSAQRELFRRVSRVPRARHAALPRV